MVKMKTPTASDMCTLFCALIVCTLVSTARTDNTTIVAPIIPTFNSSEIDEFPDWQSTHVPKTTTVHNEEIYGSKPTLGTPSVTDPNDLQYGNKSMTNDVIDNSKKTENDYHPSDKESYSSTEPIPSTVTQSLEQPPTRTHTVTTTTIENKKYGSTTTPGTLSGKVLDDTMLADEVGGSPTEEVVGNSQKPASKKYSSTEPIPMKDYNQTKISGPPTRTTTKTAADTYVPKLDTTDDDTFEDWALTQLPSTTLIAILKNGSTTTPGTPSVTDLNFKPPEDVIGNSPSQPKPKNGYDPSHKKYSSTEPIPANEYTRSKPKKQVITVVTMRSKNKYPLLDPISSILAEKEKPTRYYTTTEWIKPTNKNCKCVFGKNYLKRCKNNDEETTATTKMLSQKAEYYEREQQRRMSETTTSNIKGQLEESQKWELQRKVLEMESNRFNTILDILNKK